MATETRYRSSDSNYGDSLRRREARKQDCVEDRVLLGKLSNVQVSVQAASLAARPSSAGDLPAAGDNGASTAPPSLVSHPSEASLASTADTGSMRRMPSDHKDAVKVLCYSGGMFTDTSTDSCDRVYKGGSARLLTLHFTPDTTLKDIIDQLQESKVQGADEEGFMLSYELPDENGIYVVLATDEDVLNMYEEWKKGKDSGGHKKLRLFAEVRGQHSSNEFMSESLSQNVDSLTSVLAQAGPEAPKVLQQLAIHAAAQAFGSESGSVPIPLPVQLPIGPTQSEPVQVLVTDSTGATHQLKDTLKDRMEVIPQADITLSKLLGAGGYGEVYLGKWREATDVAVKCLSPALLSPDGEVDNIGTKHVLELLDEAQLLFNLRHPNVVWVFGIVVESPQDLTNRFRAPAIVTEYMASGSLRAAMNRQENSLNQGWVRVVLALDAAKGMEYLHSKSIVHFDLKSGNLLLGWRDRRPTCKVADFGLSKQRRQTYVSGVKSHTGTLPWMAPEILKTPDAVDELVDVYSFGIVMWELWTGMEPHKGMAYPTLLHNRMTKTNFRPPVPGTEEWADRPDVQEPAPGWGALMQRCWAEDAAMRPSFQGMCVELRDMLEAVKPRRKESNQ